MINEYDEINMNDEYDKIYKYILNYINYILNTFYN